MFIDRQHELRLLQDVAQQTRPGPGQLLLLYGRRRVGKTALLQHWATQSGIPWTYWMARKEPPDIQRRRLLSALLEQPTSSASPTFATWSDLWDAAARILRDQRHLLIVDELPYAIESDPAMLSALQYAWDTHFQQSRVILALCGSHVRTVVSILSHQSPLFGRMTAQLQLRPLPFGVLHHFFPTWSDDERVAAYAILGGVPAYLGWFDPTHSLTENIRTNLLRPTGMALAEVEFLLYDEVREPRVYLTILDAIGNGAHTLSAIAAATLIASPNLTVYLKTLQDLRLIERHIPATVPPALRDRSKQGRYHLTDPFHRFYFRFLQPNQAEIGYQPDRTLSQIQSGLRAFVGQTIWEELAREWVLHQGMADQLPVTPEVIEAIGIGYSRPISWRSTGRAARQSSGRKWGIDPVDRQVVRHLLDHTLPAVRSALPDKGDGWQLFPLLVARAGATPAAEQELRAHQGILVSLEMLARDLERAAG